MFGDIYESTLDDIYFHDMLDLNYDIESIKEIQIERTSDFNGFEGREVIVSGNPEQAAEILDW